MDVRREQLQDPEVREKVAEKARQYHQKNPEARKKASEQSKKRWENLQHREKMSEAIRKAQNRPEVKVKRSKISKKMWEGQEYRETMSKKRAEMWEDPEYRAKIREKRLRMWANPEFKARRRKLTIEQMKEIRRRYSFYVGRPSTGGVTLDDLAKEFGIGRVLLWKIGKGEPPYDFLVEDCGKKQCKGYRQLELFPSEISD